MTKLITILALTVGWLINSHACADQPIVVGAVYPLTGAAANLGESNRIGASIAVDAINRSGGINGRPVKLIIEDSRTEPRAGVSGFQKLVEVDGAHYVLASLTAVAMAIRPIAERRRILIFAESTHPDLVKGSRYMLRNFYTVDAAAEKFEEFAARKSLKQVALIHAEEDWGEAARKDLIARQSKQTFSLVGSESFAKGADDLKPQLLRLRELRPDVLYVVGIGPAVATLYRQFSELGMTATRIGFVTCGLSNVFEPAKHYLEGAYSIDAAFDRESAEFRLLEEALKRRYPDQSLDQSSVVQFDAVNLLAEAIKHAGDEAQAVREFIVTKRRFRGASGEIEFSIDGDARRPMRIQRIANQQCEPAA